MQSALKPYATAGVAIVGAGLVAVTPVTTQSPGFSASRDVALTAGSELGNFLDPWLEQYNLAAQNATTLINNFALAPFVGYQQDLANQSDFWDKVVNDPSSIPDAVDQLQHDQVAVSDALTLLNTGAVGALGSGGDPITEAVLDRTLSGELGLDLNGGLSTLGHYLLFSLLPGFLPEDLDADALQPILQFLASPLSGMIMGALGPSLSPWVALLNGITDGDDFNTILANTVGAYFNGATLNLDFLAPLINDAGLLPGDSQIYHIDLALGGLLTPGVVASADNLVGGTSDAVAAPGGSIFNSLGLFLDVDFQGIPLVADVPAHAVGPIGAWEGWMQTMGVLLGSGWSGKNDPQPAVPPISGAQIPQIPDDFFDDGGDGDVAGGAADFDIDDLPPQIQEFLGL